MCLLAISVCLLWRNGYLDFLSIFRLGFFYIKLYELFVYFGNALIDV